MKNSSSFLLKLHLWLGLGTGIIVFIVSITASILVFKTEIMDALEDWRFVEAQPKAYVAPSQLIDTAKHYVPGHEPTGLTYDGKNHAAAVGFWIQEADRMDFKVVFMNPYTAEFIRMQSPLAKENFNFFEFVEQGHIRLWLPEKIGKPSVGIAVLLYLVLLISGLILWWPKSWTLKNLKKNLGLKFSASWKRLNRDLHNSLGMYALLFLIIIALTGLSWSFGWFNQALYFTLSGGKQLQAHHHPHSDTTQAAFILPDSSPKIDQAFYLALQEQAEPERVYITPSLPDADDAIEVIFYARKGKFYDFNTYFFDQYTLVPLRMPGDRFQEAPFADKLYHMYYDLHTGSILGLPGKILAFLLSLISASLPVTGFIMWLHRRKAQRKLMQKLQL